MAIRPTQELITNRTQNDVNLKTPKGYYNYIDLNRIGEWQEYIRDVLTECGYYVVINPKKYWEIGDIPIQSQIDKIKNDTMALKEAYYTYKTTPTLETGVTHVTYSDANDIEKIIADIEYLINSMQAYYVYCGVATCGQSHMWQNKFRRY